MCPARRMTRRWDVSHRVMQEAVREALGAAQRAAVGDAGFRKRFGLQDLGPETKVTMSPRRAGSARSDHGSSAGPIVAGGRFSRDPAK